MTEEEAFELLKKGDEKGLKFVYTKNRSKCVSWAVKHLVYQSDNQEAYKCSLDEARELFQEAITILAENVYYGRLTELRVAFSTYIIATMKNLWRSRHRRKEWHLLPEVEIPAPEVDDQLEALQNRIREALNKLDEACRAMLTLRYFNQFSYEDIALVLNYKNGAVVRNLIARCRSKFRDLF